MLNNASSTQNDAELSEAVYRVCIRYDKVREHKKYIKEILLLIQEDIKLFQARFSDTKEGMLISEAMSHNIPYHFSTRLHSILQGVEKFDM